MQNHQEMSARMLDILLHGVSTRKSANYPPQFPVLVPARPTYLGAELPTDADLSAIRTRLNVHRKPADPCWLVRVWTEMREFAEVHETAGAMTAWPRKLQ
jgi:hypothetical protein